MKPLKLVAAPYLLMTLIALSVAVGLAADAKKGTGAKPKPYPLQTCLVEGDKLDADAFVFVHEGQEIKLCCEGCKGDFDKEPAKYLKRLEKRGKAAK